MCAQLLMSYMMKYSQYRGHDSVLIQTQPGLVLLPNTEYSPKSGRNWKRLQGSEMNE